MNSPAPEKADRSGAIDILRAIAVILVMGRHMSLPPSRAGGPGTAAQALLAGFMQTWNRGGWVGVDLFFVLSGFLVSGLLFREHQRFGQISPKNFLIRRGFKIYPAFWLLIAVTAVVALWSHSLNVAALISELAFVQNYGPALWNHTWSLAVEEHFYFLLLILFVVLSRRRVANPFTPLPLIFACLAVVELGLRIAITHWLPYTYKTHHFASHIRMDSLFCGVVISYFYHYHTASLMSFAKQHRWTLLILGALLLAPPFVLTVETSHFIPTVGLTLCYLGSGCVILAALTVADLKHTLTRALAYIGSHSYSIYLWHMPVQLWLMPYGNRVFGGYFTWPRYFVVFFATTIVVGILMALAVEFPMLRIRDRWFPSRARPLADAPRS